MSFYLKKNWKIVSLTCFLGLVSEAIYTCLQLIMMQSFESAIQRDFRGFLFWIILNLVGFMLYFCIAAVTSITEAYSKRKLNNQVRHDMLLSMLNKNHKELHSKDTGEYISWFTTNIKQIERLAWEPFFSSIRQFALIVCCIIALLSLHWGMLAAGLLSATIMLLLPKFFTNKMEQLGQACVNAEAHGISRMKDLISGFDVLRSFGRCERLIHQGDTISEEMERPNYRRTGTQSCISCATGLLSICLQIFQQVVAVILAFHGELILGAMVSASNLTAGITNSLRSISNNRMSMASAMPYFDSITTYKYVADIENKSSDIKPLKSEIILENITFRYGNTPVLKDISFRFEKGGKYALTGPSGCGKSTILKLLLGWLPDYQGTIRFDDRNAREFSQEELLQQMSYIEQDVFLFNTTIRDNITLGSDFTNEMLELAIKNSALDGDLANMPLGLDTPVGEDGSNLSGGQKQRVAIARALIHSRSILLMDEGTSALDQENADIVEQSILSIPDLTLILVSHHLAEERKAQFTKIYELEPIPAIPDDTCKLGVADVF